MFYKVARAFFDKTDNMKPYSKGGSYTHDDEQRIAFLIEKGFLEPKSKPPDEAELKEKPKPKKTRKKASD